MYYDDVTALSHTQKQREHSSMNDFITLLNQFFLNFHAPNSLYDMFHCSTQTVVGELTEVGQRLVVAVGGLGGKGNAALRTKGACCCIALSLHCTEPERCYMIFRWCTYYQVTVHLLVFMLPAPPITLRGFSHYHCTCQPPPPYPPYPRPLSNPLHCCTACVCS